MDILSKVEQGVFEELTEQGAFKRSEKFEASMLVRKIAKSVIENKGVGVAVDDDAAMNSLVLEVVSQAKNWMNSEPKTDHIANLAKKNRIIK